MATLKSTDKKVRLTPEQQERLRKLADSAEEEKEILKLIEESIEANRPKTVSENAYEPPELLPSLSAADESLERAGNTQKHWLSVWQTSSLKKTSSLMKTSSLQEVANELIQQACVVQSVNPKRSLTRTGSDFFTPRRTYDNCQACAIVCRC